MEELKEYIQHVMFGETQNNKLLERQPRKIAVFIANVSLLTAKFEIGLKIFVLAIHH